MRLAGEDAAAAGPRRGAARARGVAEDQVGALVGAARRAKPMTRRSMCTGWPVSSSRRASRSSIRSTRRPYTDSWSVGFQRAIGKDMSVEVRYIENGNRTQCREHRTTTSRTSTTRLRVERQLRRGVPKAQKNLAANVAAGRGATFAYTGIPGTSPLPIFLASYLGLGAGERVGSVAIHRRAVDEHGDDRRRSRSSPRTSPRLRRPTRTNGLFGNPTFRANGHAGRHAGEFLGDEPGCADRPACGRRRA